MFFEPLESRDLLTVTIGAIDNDTYNEIRATYPEFNLPELQADLNVMTITPDNGALSLSDLQNAINDAGETTLPDLILVMTSASVNSVTYASAADELSINIDSTQYGSVTILGWGEENFTLDANQQSRVMTIDGESAIVNLGGLTITSDNGNYSNNIINNGCLTVTNCSINDLSINNNGLLYFSPSENEVLSISNNISNNNTARTIKTGAGTLTTSSWINNNVEVFEGTLQITDSFGSGKRFSGQATIFAGATLRCSSHDSLGYGSSTTQLYIYGTMDNAVGNETFNNTELHMYGGTAMSSSGGSFDVINTGVKFFSYPVWGATADNPTQSTISSEIRLRTDGSLDINTAANSELTLSNVISNPYGNCTITKLGAGTLVLTAHNTYDGGLTVSQGKVISKSNNNTYSALGTGAIIVESGATLEFQASNQLGTTTDAPNDVTVRGVLIPANYTHIRNISLKNGVIEREYGYTDNGSGLDFGSRTGTIASMGNSIIRSRININDYSSATFNVESGSLTVEGSINGTGGFAKTGSGSLILSGDNSYTGNTMVLEGKLEYSSDCFSNLTVCSYATFSPGDSVGTMTAHDNVEIIDNATCLFEFSAYNANPALQEFDKLIIADRGSFQIDENSVINLYFENNDALLWAAEGSEYKLVSYDGFVNETTDMSSLLGNYQYWFSLEGRTDGLYLVGLYSPQMYSTVVNTLNDSFDLRDDEWSLREAIFFAPEYVTITFAEELEGTIVLTHGQLEIEAPIVIDGDNRITIDADQKSRAFSVFGGTEESPVVLNGLTIQNGNADYGGAINNSSGTLTITNSSIINNTATQDGGGIYNSSGTLSITDSVISGNKGTSTDSHYACGGGICSYSGAVTLTNSDVTENSSSFGGGIYSKGYNSTFSVTNSTISANTSDQICGGIYNENGSFTITSSVISSNSSVSGGAGIYNYSGDLTINSSEISSNTSGYNGGGIYNIMFSTLAINNSTISNNTANSNGGGIYNDGSKATLSITNSEISANTSSASGGGIANYSATLTITSSKFSGNAASSQGGGVYNYNGTLTITDNDISENTAYNGGGISNYGTVNMQNSAISGNSANFGGGINNYGAVTIENSSISGNTAINNGGGINIASSSGTITLNNSTIADNSAPYGGGIYNTGTVDIQNNVISGNSATKNGGGINVASGELTLNNSTVVNNTAAYGGGVANYATTTLVNDEITGNQANFGGGIYNYSGTTTLTNITIAGNTANNKGGGIFNYDSVTDVYNSIVACNTASVTGNDIAKNLGSVNGYNSLSSYTEWGLNNNYEYDPNSPLFYNADNGDYRLVKKSQAIDKGDNQLAYDAGMDETSLDNSGELRFVGNHIDLGAYEYFGITASQSGFYVGDVVFSWMQYKNTANVRLTWISGTTKTVLGTFASVGEYTWDTTNFSNGYGILIADYLDANGNAIYSFSMTSVIFNNNDNVVIHSGNITGNETWSADKVHLVTEPVNVLNGGSITVSQNAVVKFWKNAWLYVDSGASLTVQNNAVFTRAEDDEVVGDTNLDGDLSKPQFGNVYYRGKGTFNIAQSAIMKYITVTKSGTISSNQVWQNGQVYHITGDVTVARGATLTIQPGAIIKFNSGKSLIVQSGGTLNALGTVAQPVVFTSVKDDSYGGDTNEDDGFYAPAAGDWNRISCLGGTINMNYCKVMYGGNTPAADGALYHKTGTWVLKNSWVSQSRYTAIHLEAGSFQAENTIICDSLMGVNVHYISGPQSSSSNAKFTNCTLADLTEGIRMWGNSTFTNCIISNISSQITLNNNSSTRFQKCVFWNPSGYGPQACQFATGTNQWANPLFRNAAAGDYSLMAGSPCIDAGTSSGAPETDITSAPRISDPMVDRNGIVDIGAYEFTDNANSSIDLEPVNVQAPESVTTGEMATIQWTIKNNGSAAAQGSWTDTVYLVNELTGQSVLVKECVHAGSIAVGDLQTFYADVVIPAVVEGAWKFQIRVNTNREIFEGANVGNNAVLAETATNVQTSFLTESQGFIIITKNQPALYRVTVKAGDSFCLQASSDNPISIYIRENYVPNASNYDFAAVEYQTDNYSLYIAPADADRTFYLLAETTSDAARIEYAIETGSAFTILGIAPTTVSNAGSSTISVSGLGFKTGMTAELVLNDTVVRASAVNVANPSSAAITFDLTYQPAGQYLLRLTSPDSQRTELANALTVEQNGIGAKLEIDLQLPDSVRAGRVYEGKLFYANNGDCDMLVPIFTIYSDSVPLALNTNELGSEKELNVLGLGKEDSAGILRAGESGVITFYFKAGTNNKIHAYTWGTAGAMAANDSWESWSELFADISNAATQLGLRRCRDYNFNTAKQLAKAKKQDSACTGLAGYLTDSRNGSPLTNCTLILEWTEDEQTQFAQSVTDSDGHYVFNFVPKNSQCSLSILDGAYCLSKESIVIETNDQTSFNLTALPYGTISGRITDATNSQAVSGIVIHAQDENGNIVFAETDQRGCYVLNNLELGSWTITADTTGKFHSLSPVIQTVNSSESQCVNIQLDPGASISGTIVDSENNPVSGLTIYINDSAGLFFTIQTDEYGRYSAGGMSEGEIVLDFTGSSFITVEDATVEVFEHSTVVQDFQFEIGASLSGSVLNVYQQPVENAILLAKNASGSSWVAITDETGVWAISGLPVDEYTVTLYTQSLLYNQQSTIQIDSVSDFVQNFVWVETGSLSGQVVNADGRIGRGNVIVTGNSEVATFIETDLNGNFTLGDLIPGVYTLYLADESGLSYSFEIEANKNTYKVVDINVAATVAGSTKDVNGNAVPDVYVQVYQNGEVLFTTQSDEDGAFNFAFTESGVYDFYAFTYDGSQFSSFENVVIDNGDAKTLDFVEGTYTLTISDLLGLPEDSEVKDGMTYTIMRYNSSDNSPVGMIFSSDSQVFTNLANGAYEITAQNGDYLAETTIVIENESKQISLQPELLNSLTINFELPDESIEIDSIGVFGLYNSDNELLKLVYFDSLDSFELHAIRNGEYKVIALSGSYGVFQDLTINDSNESVTLSLSELNSSVSGSIRDISSGYLYVTDEDGVIQGFGCTQADGSFEIFTVSEIANGFVVDNGTNRKIAALENGLDNLAIPKSPVLGMNVTAVTPVAMAAFSDIFELKIDKLIRENNSLYWEVNSYTPSASHCSCNDLKFKSLSALKDRAFTYWKSASDNAITSSNARGDLLLKDSLMPKVTFYTTLFIVDLIGMTTHNPWASATSITLSVLNDFVNSDKTMEDLTFDIGAAVQSNFCYQGVPALANSVTIANDLRAFYSLKSDIKKFWSLRSDDVLIREYTNYYKEAEKYYKLAQMTFDLMKNIKFDNCCLDNSCCTCGCSLDENPDKPDDHNNSNVPTSSDPNEIVGPVGGDFVTHNAGTEDEPFMVIDGANWIANTSEQENEYKIYFENKTTASAAAQEITVTTVLPAGMDWDSLELGEISIGNEIYTLTDDCLIAENTWLVNQASTGEQIKIRFDYDSQTGEATWYLRSYVSSTYDNFPTSAYDGFLPPNDDNHSGDGYISYRVKYDSDLVTGDVVETSATIVFDSNEPIETNLWLNTIDVDAPEVQLDESSVIDTQISLQWSGSDVGSGISQYQIFVSFDGSAYTLWNTFDADTTSAVYESTAAGEYSFYILALDAAGNIGGDPDLTTPSLLINSEMDVRIVKERTDHDSTDAISENLASITDWDDFYMEFWTTNMNELEAGKTYSAAINYDSALFVVDTEQIIVTPEGVTAEIIDMPPSAGIGLSSINVTFTVGENGYTAPGANTYWGAIHFTPNLAENSGVQDLLEPTALNVTANGKESGTTVKAMPFDLNHNNSVDVNDFIAFATVFGQSPDSLDPSDANYVQTCLSDFDGNGVVDVQDFIAFATNFGIQKGNTANYYKAPDQGDASAQPAAVVVNEEEPAELNQKELIADEDSSNQPTQPEVAIQSPEVVEVVVTVLEPTPEYLTPAQPAQADSVQTLRQAHSSALLDLYDNQNGQLQPSGELSASAIDNALYQDDEFDFLFDDSDSESAGSSDVDLSAVLDELDLELI